MGRVESEGDVYAAKVIGQKPTVPGVKKNPEGGNCNPTLSARHTQPACLSLRLSYRPPVHAWSSQTVMVNGWWAVPLNRHYMHVHWMHGPLKSTKLQSLAVVEGRTSRV